ncbi:MAG: rhodanese-like domain-containing protein [Desulfobacterales bacterium]|nr:rhodanese-like domain-containing protein [Desulfobacterales bacterium]
MAAGRAVDMGYRDVYWYKNGIAGWRKTHNFVESSDYSYANRKIPAPLTAGELRQKLKTDERYILVDIRDDKSRKKLGSIDGPTLQFPVYRLHMDHDGLPEDKILVLYDIRAKQAPSAIRYLLKKRFYFINLTYLKGGITAWKEAGLPMAAP